MLKPNVKQLYQCKAFATVVAESWPAREDKQRSQPPLRHFLMVRCLRIVIATKIKEHKVTL